jgi:hypothetical protein
MGSSTEDDGSGRGKKERVANVIAKRKPGCDPPLA